MEFVRALNRYWDEQQPWQTIKSDRERTGTVCYVALRAIDTLKVALAPFLPFTCERLHHMLGYDGQVVGEIRGAGKSPRRSGRTWRCFTSPETRSFTLATQPVTPRTKVTRHRSFVRQTGRKSC
jgi:methionyl-tRNA synthetase